MKLRSLILLSAIIPLAAAIPTNNVSTIAKDNNAFAFDLYQDIIKTEKGNLFFSPFSISNALAMTYAGAANENAEEMAKAMHFQSNSDQFHMDFGRYISEIEKNADGNIQLRIANRLWGEKDYKLKNSFIELNKQAYNSPLQKVGFSTNAEACRHEINDWVATQTEQRIKDLLPQGAVDQDTKLVLTNAIYFKGDWLYQFDKNETDERDFILNDDATKRTKFMNQQGQFQYAEIANAQIIRLPYKGARQSMIVVLPNKANQLDKVESAVNATTLKKLFESTYEEVILALPKFKMTLPMNLNTHLNNLGMNLAFEDGADFSNMSQGNDLHISAVIHKAFIEIDEEGTEAAAATAVVMTVESISVHEPLLPKQFIADHPFLFYIVDDATNAILFMGKMMEP